MSIIRGQFLNSVTKDGEEDEMDDGVEVNISSSALDTCNVRKTMVQVRDIEMQRTCYVRGSFPCVDPLLGIQITSLMKPCGYWVMYSNFERFEELLEPLLIDRDRVQFSKFMSSVREKYNCINNLLTESINSEGPSLLKRIYFYMCRSEPCRYLIASLNFPRLMKYLPHLLPKHTDTILSSFCLRECTRDNLEKAGLQEWISEEGFMKLVEKLTLKRDVDLAEMERILVETPWKYGFDSEMYKEMHISRMEATLQSMMVCEFWDNIPWNIKNALCIYHEMKEITKKFQHTYLIKENIFARRSSFVSHIKFEDEEFRNAINFLRTEGIIHVSENNLQERFHLMYLWESEQNIAQDLTILLQKDMELLVDLEDEEFKKFRSDKDQVEAAKIIISNSLAIITGKAGCGKTELVTALLKKHHEKAGQRSGDSGEDITEMDVDCSTAENGSNRTSEVLFTTPTGKAASLVTKRSGMEAYTLHHIIISYNMWKNNKASEWKYKNVTILVIDGTSMVSLVLFAKVLRALTKDAKLCKVILLGDLNQLSSIEPGDILKELYEVMNPKGFCVELRTNHRSEGALIVENATRIASQQMPIIDPLSGFYLILARNLKSPSSYGTSHAFPSREELDNLFRGRRPGSEFFQGRNMQTASQLVSFTRKSCRRINEVAVKFYNGHKLKVNRDTNKMIQDFQIGDKIICCRNKDVRLYDENGNTKGVSRFMNGSMYMVKDDKQIIQGHKKISFLTLDNMSGVKIHADLGDLKNATKIEHAWALTIHKFQGSECDTLVYIMSGSPYENWQHVYTAVTRSKKRVFIVAQEEGWLSDAVKRKPDIRQTSLTEHFHNLPRSGAFPGTNILKASEEKEKGYNGHKSTPGDQFCDDYAEGT